MEFKPERHLDEKGQLKAVGPPNAREESHFTYGFGRRVCVGKHVANVSLSDFPLFFCSSWVQWDADFVFSFDRDGSCTEFVVHRAGNDPLGYEY